MMDKTHEVLSGPLDLLREAWVIYKNRFWTLLVISLLPTLAPALVTVVTAAAAAFLFIPFPLFLRSSLWWVLFVPLGLLWWLVILVTFVWGELALLYAIQGHKVKVDWRAAFRLGRPKIVHFWWVSLLMGFLVGGGVLLFVIPGLVLALFFSLTYFVLVAEDERGLRALLKSREYLRGYEGAVLGRLVFLSVAYILTMALALGLSRWLFPSAKDVLGRLVPFFFGSLATIYVFLLYQKLKFLQKNLVWPPTRQRKTPYLLIGFVGWGLALIALVAALGVGGTARSFWERLTTNNATSWEDCLKARGSSMLFSYPGVCVTADGRQFVQPLTEEERKKIQPPREVIAPPAGGAPDQTDYLCPETDWVDCMPILGTAEPQCSPKYLQWAKDNCPNFQGAAY